MTNFQPKPKNICTKQDSSWVYQKKEWNQTGFFADANSDLDSKFWTLLSQQMSFTLNSHQTLDLGVTLQCCVEIWRLRTTRTFAPSSDHFLAELLCMALAAAPKYTLAEQVLKQQL